MTTPRTCLLVVLDGLAGNYGDGVAPGICAGGEGAIVASTCNLGMADKVVPGLAVQDRERCLAKLGNGVIVDQALSEDVVVGRAERPCRHPRSADGGSYASAVVSRSASCLALLARRSGFKLGMLAQTMP
jgi:hypothetical protein